MYTFKPLTQSPACAYEPFTFPSYRLCLRQLYCGSHIIAVGVLCLNQPIGLGLAQINPDSPEQTEAEILSLYIQPKHRNQGLGTQLLMELEAILQQRGCTKVEIIYMTPRPMNAVLERILAKCQWSEPLYRMMSCKSNTETMAVAPWRKRYRFPETFTVFPWVELTQEERDWILQRQAEKPWYPEILSPFFEEDRIEPITSVGLRFKEEIVGWLVSHRIAPNIIRYTRLFVREDMQAMGRALGLLTESFNRHYDNFKHDYGICTIMIQNQGMVKFALRHMGPYLTDLSFSKGALKLLVDSSTELTLAQPEAMLL